MIPFLTRNLGWKLLSLVIAFGVWLNVASEPELATVVSVPVEYSHFPKNFEISSEIVESIDFEARGPAGLLRRLSDSQIAAIIDFSGVTSPGERTFTLTNAELRLPRGVSLIRTIPAQLRFTFERHATRAVPVEVHYSGALPKGYSVTHVDVLPPELEIAGPESRVNAAKKVVADPFDLTGITTDSQRILSVYVAESEVRLRSAPQVTVKIHVQKNR
jgi:hypothetical protein